MSSLAPNHRSAPPPATNGPPTAREIRTMTPPSEWAGCKMVLMSAPKKNRPVHSPDGTSTTNPHTTSAIPAAIEPDFFGAGSGFSIGSLAQFHVQPGAVEHIIGVERDDLSLRRDEVDARALHGRDAEIVLVEKLHDDDPEHFVIAEFV